MQVWTMRGLPDGFAPEGTGGGHPGTWLAPFVPSCDWLMRQMPSLGDAPAHRTSTTAGGTTTMTVIGIDAHKKTHTCVAVDSGGAKVAEETVATTSTGHAQALRWARKKFGTDVTWGVADVRSLTGLLERELLAAGQKVVRVPPHVMARNRGSTRAWGKSDPLDALAVARAVLRDPDLPAAFLGPPS